MCIKSYRDNFGPQVEQRSSAPKNSFAATYPTKTKQTHTRYSGKSLKKGLKNSGLLQSQSVFETISIPFHSMSLVSAGTLTRQSDLFLLFLTFYCFSDFSKTDDQTLLEPFFNRHFFHKKTNVQ